MEVARFVKLKGCGVGAVSDDEESGFVVVIVNVHIEVGVRPDAVVGVEPVGAD